MLEIKTEPTFDKDIKIYTKKHYDFSELKKVITILENNMPLPGKYKNHALKGNFQGMQECHINNNILLIYKITNNFLFLIRFGNYKDLLGK